MSEADRGAVQGNQSVCVHKEETNLGGHPRLSEVVVFLVCDRQQGPPFLAHVHGSKSWIFVLSSRRICFVCFLLPYW